jgi:hypothetical protein
MRFNFFEEYPTLENLEKAKLIDFKSTIFLTANSFDEYKENQKLLNSINSNLSTAYWPILPNSYWISPFSNTKDLQNFIKEIFSIDEPLTILVDLELPLFKHKELYFKNFFSFSKNKKILKKFFKEAPSHNINIVTAEYPPFFIGINFIYRLLGISFNIKKYKHTQCIMYYTSMIPNKLISKLIKNRIIKARKINPNLQLGLGTIATGVLGNEPIVSVSSLKNDIDFMKLNNIETGIVFRFGGLNEDYIKLLKNNI